MGRLLVLGIKEGLVECATLCVKSGVILRYVYVYFFLSNSDMLWTFFNPNFTLSTLH